MRLYFLDNLRWTYDEGIHVLLAQMLARGYSPYSELFVSYPPLYTLSIDWTWKLFGTVEALQILMSLYTMAGIIGVGLIAWRLGGLWAGIFAPVFLSLEPEFFRGSRAVLTEVPSISVAALAIAFAAFYLWKAEASSGRSWLIASGITLGISLMLKILSPFVIGLIGLMIIVRVYQQGENRPKGVQFWRRVAADAFIWGLALLLPVIILTALYDVPALLDQAVRFRFASRGAYEGEENNFLFALSFLRDNWVITILALIGFWSWKQWFRQGWFVPVWLLLALAFALIQVPLRDKHLPLLLPPLAIIAGLGLTWLWQRVQFRAGNEFRTPGYYDRYLSGLSISLIVIFLTIYLGQTIKVFAGFSRSQTQYLDETDQILVEFIQKFTAPGDCLITDDPTLAFVADRPVPPNLAEASSARLRSGFLTEEMLATIATQAECQIVAPVAQRFKRSTPGFVEWSKANYLGLWLYDNATEILIAKPITNPQPEHPIQGQFGDQVELVGFDLSPTTNHVAYLSLYWRSLKPFEQDYSIFVHVRDSQNNTLVNADHQPYNNLVPTSRWPVGLTVKESVRLELPQELPQGEYRIIVGIYSPVNLERLPVQPDMSGENGIVLQSFYNP